MSTLVKALVVTEDHRFYKHWGVDPVAIFRAMVINFTERRRAQGGSTITQQLARTLYLHNRKTITRKLMEMVIALYLEVKFSKNRILGRYMKEVYMGQDKNGVPIKGFVKASKYYFGKLLGDTSLVEQAALVAMLKGPNIYRPSSSLGTARRVMVLGKMLDNGIINEDQFFEASRNKL
jgi:membrane peptidoglycan carboxypeptidase